MAPVLMAAAVTLSPQIIPPFSTGSGVAGGQPAVAVPVAAAPANFASTDTLTLALGPDLTAQASVDVVPTDNISAVSFYVKLARSANHVPCAGTVALLGGIAALTKGQQGSVPIEITGCAAEEVEGVIGITGSLGAQRERKIVLTRAGSCLLTANTGLSLALALLLAVAAGIIARLHGHKLSDAIGDASWDFSSSWASNVTAFATVFAFVTQLTVFPVKPSIASRSEYAFLAAFALALVALAPAVQRAAGSEQVVVPAAVPAVVRHSLVGGFLLGGTFTLWGAFLQFGTQFLILEELDRAVSVSKATVNSVRAVIVLSLLGIAVYGLRTMLTTIAGNASRSATPKAVMNLAVFRNATVPPATARARKIAVL